MIFTSVAPVMAKLLGLFLTAAQIFDNRREEIGQDRAVLTALIQTVPLPDDDRSCRCAHFAGNEIDSLGSVHSN